MLSGRRFALVSPNFYPRVCGVGDYTARLGDELRRRGHGVAVFTRQAAERNPEAPDVEVHALEGRTPGPIAWRAAQAISRWQPTDVIFQYTSQMWDAWRFGSPALPWLANRARGAGVRTALIAHEPFVPWMARPDLVLAAVLQRAQFAALLKTCDHVFVTTETRVSNLEPMCRLLRTPAPGVIRVGANALPVARRNALEGRSTAAPRVGVYSTAAVGKRFDVVLDAFARIASEIPEARLVVIGDLGSPERPLVREVLDGVRRHPAADRIALTGRLPLAQIADAIAELDVFMFPIDTGANTRSSTLPTPLGCGIPVVAVRGVETDGALFRHRENILFAQELSGGAFASEALTLLRDPTLMARVAHGARRLYDDHLSWSRIADQLLAQI